MLNGKVCRANLANGFQWAEIAVIWGLSLYCISITSPLLSTVYPDQSLYCVHLYLVRKHYGGGLWVQCAVIVRYRNTNEGGIRAIFPHQIQIDLHKYTSIDLPYSEICGRIVYTRFCSIYVNIKIFIHITYLQCQHVVHVLSQIIFILPQLVAS